MFDEESTSSISTEGSSQFKRTVPTLKSFCEGVAAESLVEPRNALQILEICDSLGAVDLTRHCEDVIIRNIDFIFTLSTQAVATTALEVLANLEKTFDLKSAESWSSRRLPTPTDTFPVVLSSDKEDGFDEPFRLCNSNGKCIGSNFTEEKPVDFRQNSCSVDDTTDKQVRALRKKLQQIEILEAKQLCGKPLDKQQEAKLGTKELVQNALANLGSPVEREVLIEEKDNSRLTLYTSHKQRRKIKHKGTRVGNCAIDVETPTVISSKLGFPDIPLANIKEKGDMVSVANAHIQNTDKCYIGVTTGNMVTQTDKKSSSSKKKNRKGGLSMFLSGALDAKPQEVAFLPPKNEEPAWRGATFSKGSTSFRDIQNEQSKNLASQTCRNPVNKTPGPASPCPEIVNIRPTCFGSFLEGPLSSPISVPHLQASPTSDGDRSIPPWTSHSTSPGLSRPSLKDIQIQQGKRNQNLSHSPSQGSPSDVGGISRWLKPEIETPSSIRSIQIEEKAVKDLKRYYSSVKIVKSQQ